MTKSIYDEQHTIITDSEAVELFHPERLKTPKPTRWDAKPQGAMLAVLTVSKGFLDLCWWNEKSKAWTYINTLKNKL